MKATATIRNWTIVKAGKNSYIKGNVFHDIKGWYNDGDLGITTPILEGGGGFIVTYDAVYKLE